MTCEVWVLPPSKRVLVTEYPGPPMEISGFISEAARQAALKRGYPTVSDIGFPSECFLGSFELPAGGGWGEAARIAEAKARELGFRVEYDAYGFRMDEPEDESPRFEFEPITESDED